jgi:SnoaL-like protein
MSAERYRECVEAFNRRDWEGFCDLMDEDVEVESRLAQMEGIYRGHAGLRRWWDDLLGAIPDYVLDLDEVRDLGNFALAHGRGLANETPLVDAIWQPSEWRGRKCLWWKVCLSEAEALEAIDGRR